MDSAAITNECLIHHNNNGLASIALIDQIFPSPENHRHVSRLISRPLYSRSGRFQEPQSHFLDACFLCKKPLGCNRDIFMYRGDIPFCSVECRNEQIEIDEAKEKKQSRSTSIKALRKNEEREKSAKSSPKYPFCSGAVVAA